ncbi:YegP family protein [Rhodovibrionaceae bacterium A322]
MAKFEIFVGQDDNYYFHLKADNGEIIAASQSYTTKASAEKGIAAVKRTAPDAEVVDLS